MTTYHTVHDARGVKVLLSQRHEIAESRSHDTNASAIIIDLHSAIESAGLTNRQAESIAWVYGVGVDQTIAAGIMGVTQGAIAQFIDAAAKRIADVFIRWEEKGAIA